MRISTYFRKNYALLVKSITRKDALVSFFSDISFVAVFVLLYYSVLIPIQNMISDLESQLEGGAVGQAAADSLEAVAYSSLLLFIVFVLGITIFFFGSRLFMWRRLLKLKAPSELRSRKFSRYVKHYFSSLLFSLIFLALPLILFAVNITQIQDIVNNPERLMAFSVIIILVLMLMAHMFPIFNMLFAKTTKTKHSLKYSFKVGIFHIHYFLLPYVLLFVLSYGIHNILIRIGRIFPLAVYTTIYISTYLVLVTLTRLYLGKLVAVLYKKSLKESQ